MESYFHHIVSKLSYDEMSVLGYLSDNLADAMFKSIKKKDVQNEINLSTANFRKALYRLEANRFIEINSNSKEHRLFITEFGQLALNEQLQEEEI